MPAPDTADLFDRRTASIEVAGLSPDLRPAAGAVLFTVVGRVEHVPVRARWIEGQGLECPDVLLTRARLVVAMGESFGDGTGLEVVASLDQPTAAMLTLLRAVSRVTSVELNGTRLAEAATRRTLGPGLVSPPGAETSPPPV